MKTKTQARWDKEVDVLVIGGGAGGMTAAITAHIHGSSVLLVEKTDRIGGSTAISGGAVWAPLNSQSAAVGHPDTFEKAWSYMCNTVGDAAPEAMQRAFLNSSAEAVDFLEKNTELKLAARKYSPDYYPDREGAAFGGRSLDPVMFDGRLLGEHFRELRDPLPEFMVLGGMMITMTDVNHLLAVTRSFASWKEGMKLVLRFFGDRLRGYHRGTRLVLGNALAARLFKTVLDRRIEYWLASPLKSLITEGSSVMGAEIERDGRVQRIRAKRGVVVATGGFPWSTEMRGRLYPQPTGPWSMSPQGNAGEGIEIARAAGASMGSGHFSPAFWAPVSILQKPDGSHVRYPHLVWDRAKPGLMAVNAAGKRFVNESTSYHEFVIGMYRSHQTLPTLPAYLICDSDFIERWGLGLALPGGRPREHLVRAGYLYRAATLDELAAKLGIDAKGLNESAEQFNRYAQAGEDEAFGKGSTAYNRYLGDAGNKPNECLGPLQKGPFYAVKVYAGDIGTACGIRCNENAQALDADGQPISGLYAAGNDMQSVMGGQYPAPGITLGPALTFGWIAGRHVAQHTTQPQVEMETA
ncbi:FAD-dependent oxidoreductase [Variovorax sp. YR216]|uniref:FAD-dependent oxidoreductase n=1 Tax=Variovorax sp. YR216 TaxID=1882828 RepID=UPI000894EF72|nr:FAD-dependent oxidoreductase [Variovorax sp. YR216]SEB05847.1 Succinate dehydrogenase/fumarate reductase, flavoprotein subunit [Variovorax sp. YR216]